MFTVSFARSALERALKTAAQTLIALWGAVAFDAFSIDWGQAGGVALGAAVLSVLTSIASGAVPLGDPQMPSLTKTPT